MTTEPAAASDAHAPPRRPVGTVPTRALRTLPGGHQLELPRLGRGHDLRRSRQGRHASGTCDGNEYVDLRMGYGPVILGHGDDRVDDYVNERMRQGVSFSLTSEDEVRAIELAQGAHRLGREGPDDGVRHRGDDARDARRAGVHRPQQDREVRGPVPRRPRLRADQRRARTTCRELGDADNPVGLAWGRGIPEAVARHDHPGTLQRDRRPAPDLRARRRRDRRDHRRAGARQRPGDHAAGRASTRRCGP